MGEAIREVIKLHEEQFQSIVGGDLDSTRFDPLIHMANERKHEAKYIFTIWRLTAVQNSMSLTKSERAKITDSVHSIQ